MTPGAAVPEVRWPEGLPRGDEAALAADLTEDQADTWAWWNSLLTMRESGYVGADYDRMLHLGFPREGVLEDWTLDSYPATTPQRRQALRAGRLIVAGQLHDETGRHGLLLTGRAGRGKTGLAVAIGWALTGREGKPGSAEARFVSWPRLVRQMLRLFGQGTKKAAASVSGDQVSRLVAEYTAAQVLILDDLGDPDASGPAKPWQRQILKEIVWPRYDSGRPMVVTSNLTGPRLAEQFGEPLASRLAGACVVCPIDGQDERMKAVVS